MVTHLYLFCDTNNMVSSIQLVKDGGFGKYQKGENKMKETKIELEKVEDIEE